MNHKDLDAWKNAMLLAERVYVLTREFPGHEQFGMISQLRRAAVSVPSNLAEGSARNSNKVLSQFLNISLGSLAEIETQIILSHTFGYINNEHKDEIIGLLTTCSKQISGLNRYIKTHEHPEKLTVNS
jgi:four helix bundle protein